jgi:hypothetical protein
MYTLFSIFGIALAPKIQEVFFNGPEVIGSLFVRKGFARAVTCPS